HQAFNLDLWLVEEIGQKMGWDVDLTRAFSLGLYVATEMVLVEKVHMTDEELVQKNLQRKNRLSILINF
ncbi:MAG: hypothetical protein NZM02_01895, partial [Patescibacteria group bacterium]|nr:hypothetical protein [Patescibacteria group bacterium]